MGIDPTMDSGTHELPRVKTGKLHVLGKRTRGGLAEIFLAMDASGQQVILRRLRPLHRLNFTLRRRFVEGIRIRRVLGCHPNIVRYYSETGGWLPSEVIEYVPGDSLKALIVNRHRVVNEQPFAILRQAIFAVGHVHERGFLHLDVKPENFLVTFTGDGCQIKLTDFDFSVPASTRQVSRRFGGSLMYAPPEFLTGKNVSFRTDTFALGVLAYYLFTFHMPFVESSQDLTRNDDGQVRFSSTSSRLSPAVQSFLQQSLAPRPEQRFADGDAMLKALDRTELQHQTHKSREDRTPGRPRNSHHRRS